MRKVITGILFAFFCISAMCRAEVFPIGQLQESNPIMAQYYIGCSYINQYIRTKRVESLEDALVKLNPAHLKTDRFRPDSIVEDSGICDFAGHFVYDYQYALAVYEEREIPKEFGLQRGGQECKVALLALKPHSSVVYKVESYFDFVEMLTICEPGSIVTIQAKEIGTGKIHNGELFDDDTVCHTSWSLFCDDLEITITNTSDEITSLAFLIN